MCHTVSCTRLTPRRSQLVLSSTKLQHAPAAAQQRLKKRKVLQDVDSSPLLHLLQRPLLQPASSHLKLNRHKPPGLKNAAGPQEKLSRPETERCRECGGSSICEYNRIKAYARAAAAPPSASKTASSTRARAAAARPSASMAVKEEYARAAAARASVAKEANVRVAAAVPSASIAA